MPVTVGTAGHIDHGKTWLVRALTGKDTDRLPEEQRRGISIDLGYAPLELPDGQRLSLIDVPGHERFVRNMVAGATGIDLFLLVIDAGEGARPQTHEHLAIIRLLGLEHGVVAVTKSDAVDEETLELALDEARELVPEAEAIAVSAKTGAGLDELRAALARAAELVFQKHKLADSERGAALRRPRLLAARDRDGRDRDALVGDGRRGRRAPRGAVGPRRAGAERPGARPPGRAGRGGPASGARAARRRAERAASRRRARRARRRRPSYRLDVALEELEPIADGARLHVHHGTAPCPRASPRPAASRSCVWPHRSSRRAATGSSSATGRPSAAASCSIRARPARRSHSLRAGAPRRGSVDAPTLVDGEWRFSDEWLAELEASSSAELDASQSARPRHPRADRALGEGRARAAAVRAAGLEALPAGRDGSARAA